MSNENNLSLISQIKQMHFKFGINYEKIAFSSEEKMFRYIAMLEEISEYRDADNKADELDAIIDLIVFALGTLERQGMLDVFNEAFKRVMDANMLKEIGTNRKRNNFKLDLIKPKNWVPADLTSLVQDELF